MGKVVGLSSFQSRTGFPGHLASAPAYWDPAKSVVSIPNGLPRPFSPQGYSKEALELFGVSIPNGLPRPFSPEIPSRNTSVLMKVSIPNGLPRPFSHKLRGPYCGRTLSVSIPNGLPRPFSHASERKSSISLSEFQSRTGFPGHLAVLRGLHMRKPSRVSIPNGLPRPFSRSTPIPNGLPRPFSHGAYVYASDDQVFQSRTGFPGHLACGASSIA